MKKTVLVSVGGDKQPLTIKGSGRYRPILWWEDLTEKEQEGFDWIDEGEEGNYNFARFNNYVYCLDDFTVVPMVFECLGKWDGYLSQGFGFGLLLRYSEDGDGAMIARYY